MTQDLLTLIQPFTFPLAQVEAHGPGGSADPGAWLLQANVPNVLLAALILGVVASKLDIPAKLSESARHIAADLDEASHLHETAAHQHRIAEEERNAIPSRRAAALTQAEQTAQQVRWQIEQQSEQEALRLQASTNQRIALEEKRLSFQLQQRLVAEFLALLQQQLAAQANEGFHRQMVERLIDRLPSLMEQQPMLRRAAS